MKQILVQSKVKKRIINDLGTSYNAIHDALHGTRDTELSRKIRAKALEYGGVEVER